MVAVDLDYGRLRAPWRRGIKVLAASGLARQAALVWFRDTRDGFDITWADVIQGPDLASRLLRALSPADLIFGHGLLTSDLVTMAMVTPVRDAILNRCVDTFEVVHSLVRRAKDRKGLIYPTGMGLSDLVSENTPMIRTKPPTWQMAELSKPARRQALAEAHRKTTALEDAELVIAVREAMLWSGRVRVGGRRAGGLHEGDHGVEWSATPPAEYRLDEIAADQLRGFRLLGAAEWRRRSTETGEVLLQMRRKPDDAALARVGFESHGADLSPLQDVWERLATAWPMSTPTSERLLSALQELPGVKQNLDHRTALVAGRYTRAKHRAPEYALAAWQYARRNFFPDELLDEIERRERVGEWQDVKRDVMALGAGATRVGI